jgi:hypothetical protein
MKFCKTSEADGNKRLLQARVPVHIRQLPHPHHKLGHHDLATEMPVPNFQYYVQALGGTGLALGIIGLANFLAMAAVAFPGGE